MLTKGKSYYSYLGPEDHLHIQVCQLLTLQYPKATWCHVANEAKRSKFERWKFKMLKAKPGLPDLMIFDNGGCAIELKIGKNKPTDNQSAWLKALSKLGWRTAVCYTYEEATKVIKEHFKNYAFT